MRQYVLLAAYEDYEIINDVITFRENGTIAYKFPIPKGYKLVYVDEKQNTDYYYFIISKNKLDPPKYIPEGYTNLTMSPEGLYKVERESSKYPIINKKGENTYITTPKRVLYYMDTSIITPNDLMMACNNIHKISEDEMPQNFWFSNQYRDFHNVFEHITHRSDGNEWYEGCYNYDIPNYIQKFDPNFRLINEYELLTIDAYNGHGKLRSLLFDNDLYEKYCTFSEDCKVHISSVYIELDNWWKVVSSMENPNIYFQG